MIKTRPKKTKIPMTGENATQHKINKVSKNKNIIILGFPYFVG